VVNYYRLAYNLSNLDKWKWVMHQSLVKTLAAKLQISVPHVYRKYHATLLVNGISYQGLQVVRQREGKPPLVATWGGIPLKWSIQATLQDYPPASGTSDQSWNNNCWLKPVSCVVQPNGFKCIIFGP
jgi:hypothetical protein